MVRYLAALCGSHLVTHQFLKALMLEGNPNIPIQSQTTCRHDHSCKCDAIIDLSSTLSHSFSLYCIANCIYQLISYYCEIKEIKKHSPHQVFLFVLIQHPYLDADTDQSEFNTGISYILVLEICSPKLTET